MADDEYALPDSSSLSLSPGVAWGLSGLLIGCTLLITASAVMVFNVLLFQHGLRGIDVDWARRGASVAVIALAGLGILAVGFGIRGWNSAAHRGESAALGIAGTAAGMTGLIAWLIAGIDMLAILQVIE